MAHYTRRMSSTHKESKPNEKHPKFGHLPLSTSGPQDCAVTGAALLNTPYLNKGAGFPAEERKQFKLTGLLPQNVQTLDQQVKRAYQQYSTRKDDLAKNTFMTSLGAQNEVLYYRVSLIFPKYIFELSPCLDTQSTTPISLLLASPLLNQADISPRDCLSRVFSNKLPFSIILT
jgi:malate dehydrogenase (oxaloacetate-decarboxylating)